MENDWAFDVRTLVRGLLVVRMLACALFELGLSSESHVSVNMNKTGA